MAAGPLAAEGDQASPELKAIMDRFRSFEKLTQLVQREYVRPVSREELWEGAYRGMVGNLDPHSRYLSKREVLLRSADPEGRHVGFGFDWRWDVTGQQALVTRVVEGGPAAAAGLVRGDALLQVDGEDLSAMTPVERTQHMLGLGEAVRLQVRHADDSIQTLAIERAPYRDTGIADARMLADSDRIAYIRISRFVDRSGEGDDERSLTATRFREELDRLAEAGMRALVLDLRGNGGGSLKAAVEVADCFLDAGPNDDQLIVAQVGRKPAHQARHVASSTDTYPHWPLALLIDSGTASSAEALAAALRDHRRALLVGEATLGKDTVQQQFLLDDGAALLLTVAHYRTPSGRNLATDNLQPDVRVSLDDQEHLELVRQRRADPAAALVQDPMVQRAHEVLFGVLLHNGSIGLP